MPSIVGFGLRLPAVATAHQRQHRAICGCHRPSLGFAHLKAHRTAFLPSSHPAGRRQRRLGVVRATSGLVQKLDAAELEVAIADRDKPLIIDFYATWCGPCVLLAQELEAVAAELGDAVRIVKVDTDENSMLASQLQIQGLPTIVFVGMDKDKPALRTEGLLPAATIKEILAGL